MSPEARAAVRVHRRTHLAPLSPPRCNVLRKWSSGKMGLDTNMNVESSSWTRRKKRGQRFGPVFYRSRGSRPTCLRYHPCSHQHPRATLSPFHPLASMRIQSTAHDHIRLGSFTYSRRSGASNLWRGIECLDSVCATSRSVKMEIQFDVKFCQVLVRLMSRNSRENAFMSETYQLSIRSPQKLRAQ